MKFAYLFERFPSFTQTFCYREVGEIVQKGVDVSIFSIRPAEGEVPLAPAVVKRLRYLPDQETLKKLARKAKTPRLAKEALAERETGDKMRIYEALWLGPILKEMGIGHVHVHFAGLASRTAHWLKMLYGISYSFTVHANDVFEATNFKITVADLVAEAAFIATVSDFSKAWLQQRYPDAEEKIHRVYNGVAVDVPAPAADCVRQAGKPARILSVGRLIEKKGYECLIEACGLLRERGLAFECRIVGGGPLEKKLRQQIDSLSLGESVWLEGAQPFSLVRQYFEKSDIFALPCAPEAKGGMDNLPTVIVEAMLYGLPVVSTRLAGVPEMVENSVTGILVETASAPLIADALEEMIGDPRRSASMGQAGYQRVVEQFSVHVTAQSLLELIAACEGSRPRKGGRGEGRSFWQRVGSLLGR